MKKTYLIFAFCSLLWSCGFTPMYSESLSAETEQIYIEPISGTNGIDLRNSLKAKFGTDSVATPKYILTIKLQNPNTIYKALQLTGDATWQEVRLFAQYTLKNSDTGEILIDANDTASESYTFVQDLVASQASYNNAVQSAIRILSDKIETRIDAKLAK